MRWLDRLLCGVAGHHWFAMTGEGMWEPIECRRCGYQGPPSEKPGVR